MPSYTIANKNLATEQLQRIYAYAKKVDLFAEGCDLDYIFNIAVSNPSFFQISILLVNNLQKHTLIDGLRDIMTQSTILQVKGQQILSLLVQILQ